jgi:hypothetical protein
VWVLVVVTNATSYDVLMVVLCCMPWDLYWTFGRRLLPTNLGGNQKMNIKLNSMFNILHNVLDQLVVVPCWLDLATHYLGARAIGRKFECKSCPIATWKHDTWTSIPCCLVHTWPPSLQKTLNWLEKTFDECVMQA